MKIQIVIPTVDARMDVAAELAAELYDIPWVHRPVISCGERSWEDIPTALERGLEAMPDADWILWLEDDVALGPDFDSIPDLLLELPSTAGIASFFSLRDRPSGWQKFPLRDWWMTQCIAFPPDLVAGVREYGTEWVAKHPDSILPTDTMLREYVVIEHGREIRVYFPSLVQHRDLPSVIKGRSTKRQSPSFTRAYGSIKQEKEVADATS